MSIRNNSNQRKSAMKIKAIYLAFLLLPASLAEAQEPEKWNWTVAPYLWASSVGLDLTIADDTAIGGDAAFSDLLDKVDTVFMGHLEARKGSWGMYLDTIYLDLSESKSAAVGPGGPILGDLNATARMKMKVYDAGATYRLSKPDADVHLDLLGGLRYIAVDVDALLSSPGPILDPVDIRTGPSETDLMLGVRAIGQFAPRWHWALRGDYSFGGSEGTYNGLASVGYTFGASGLFSMTLGYRYMLIELNGTTQRGSPSSLDTSLSGPLLGFIFKF
jgi:hypothetical protein